MLDSVLTRAQRDLLNRERRALEALHIALATVPAEDDDEEALHKSMRQLDELFLLVVVGEFNSGKSTFINALLGSRILEEGVTPTTSKICRLRYGPSERLDLGEDAIQELSVPAEILRHIDIVDTPGTNALERQHEVLTRRFIPRADLVLFVTSADRPFTESERAFIAAIREWGKKLVMVVNKTDFLTSDEDHWEVEKFVRSSAEKLLGFEPELFMVSAKQGLEAKLAGDEPAKAADSHFFALEGFLSRTLDEKERVRLKLLNPLGVGLRLAERYRATVDSRLELLQEDFRTLEDVDAQLGVYQDDMRSEFRFRLADIDNELHSFEKRGTAFFDDNLRLARALDLINKDRMQAEFEHLVIADTPRKLEKKVAEIIDWMIGAELEQWHNARRHLEERRMEHRDRVIGRIADFDYNRENLLGTVGKTAQHSIEAFDEHAEARRLADTVRNAVAGTALVEVGALGLGTIFTLIATSQLADFTGILAASTLAVVGFFILPARRRKAKSDLTAKILGLRRELLDTLTAEFDREVDRGVHRVQEAIAPYTRFVRAESQKLTDMKGGIDQAGLELERVKVEIEAL